MNDPLGIPNVCFSLEHEVDEPERKEKYKKQRLERGFDDTELWNFDFTIASFIYPRLKRFKEIVHGYSCSLTEEEWDQILDKMLFTFEYLSSGDCSPWEYSEEEQEKIQEGLNLFAEHFQDLWD